MDVIGHRGCPAYAPENTVAAVRRAAPHVDAVEIDVRRCGSGELVVFHDETLDRLTDGSGRVRDADWEALSTLGVAGTDEPIPRLDELLEAVPADVAINVELKETGLAEDAARALDRTPNEAFVSSFLPDALAEIRGSGYPIALLFTERWSANLELAAELGCEYVHPEYRLLGPERIAAAHEAGFAVNAWTVPSAESVRELADAGADGVIVDDWVLAGGAPR